MSVFRSRDMAPKVGRRLQIYCGLEAWLRVPVKSPLGEVLPEVIEAALQCVREADAGGNQPSILAPFFGKCAGEILRYLRCRAHVPCLHAGDICLVRGLPIQPECG